MNVYVVVPVLLVLMVDGLHVPVTPLFEVVGNTGAVAFWQSGPTAVNVGVSRVVMVISIVVVLPHWPAFGVKVYVVVPSVDVLMVAGFHVPVIPLLEIVGNAGAVAFWHNSAICVNVGVICDVITIFIVVTAAHCPALGVKVYVVAPVVDVLIAAGLQLPVMPLLDVVGNTGAVAF